MSPPSLSNLEALLASSRAVGGRRGAIDEKERGEEEEEKVEGVFFFVVGATGADGGIRRSIIARHLSIFRPSLKRFEFLLDGVGSI